MILLQVAEISFLVLTRALTTMQATHMYAARTYFSILP
jgi:hypothetical protein